MLGTGGHYSKYARAGNLVFISGQVPRGDHLEIIGSTIEAQTNAAMENLTAVLESAGLTLSDVVKTTVYLSDLRDAPAFNREYASHFEFRPPARTVIGVSLNVVKVEIEAIAVDLRRDPPK
jgi:reactive intermediate/imine deaminase